MNFLFGTCKLTLTATLKTIYMKNFYFHEYVERTYDNVWKWRVSGSWIKKIFQVIPRLLGDTLRDAFLELLFFAVFIFSLISVAQRKDMMTSFFEPGGLYGRLRFIVTIMAVMLFSVSLWIIPAFMFEWREQLIRSGKQSRFRTSLFNRHLFFLHRILAMLPYWGMAIVVHAETRWKWAVLAFCLLQTVPIALLYVRKETPKRKIYRQGIMLGYLFAVVVVFTALCFFFQEKYSLGKLLFSLLLILLSLLMYGFFYHIDTGIRGAYQSRAKFTPSSVFWSKYRINTIIYVIVGGLHVAVMWLVLSALNMIDVAPESLMLFIFSFYIFFIDMAHYIAKISRTTSLIVASLLLVIGMILVLRKDTFNHSHLDIDFCRLDTAVTDGQLLTLDNYYEHWKTRIPKNGAKPYPVVLVAGEGGGSRAGYWFSKIMVDLEVATGSKLRDHMFSISTVSGSTVGAAALYSMWDYRNEHPGKMPEHWKEYPRKVFRNNFTSSSISGMLTRDWWLSFLPGNWKYDRNSDLQQQEAICIQRALYEVSRDTTLPRMKLFNMHASLPLAETPYTLNKGFLSYFCKRDSFKTVFRNSMPLLFVNTARAQDCRRGIIAPVQLQDKEFPDAIDISRFIYGNSFFLSAGDTIPCLQQGLDLGAACNTSELFPFLNAPARVKNLGYFVDGGYHDNSGLKTTMDIYRRLRQLLQRDTLLENVEVIVLYLKNSPDEKKYYPGEVKAVIPSLQPLQALTAAPFSGSASYFEEMTAIDLDSKFLKVGLNHRWATEGMRAGTQADSEILQSEYARRSATDTLMNFPLARWLSKFIITQMDHQIEAHFKEGGKLDALVKSINKLPSQERSK